jgi:protein-disulfide isomerase
VCHSSIWKTAGRASRHLLYLATAALVACGEPPRTQGEADTREPIARLDGEPIYRDQVEPAVAFQVYRRQVDIYSLLKRETEKLIDERLLAQEAERRGLTPEQLLRREVDGAVEPASEEDVDRYLREHPQEATAAGDQARPRIRHYLSETRKIERRLAFAAELRARSQVEFLLEPPSPPRTAVDVEGAPARGASDAPVTLVHFAAFGSPDSARSARNLEQLRQEFPGRFRWVHRNFPNRRSEIGLLAAEVGFAAQETGRFWDFHDRVFALEGGLDPSALGEVTRAVGLDPRLVEQAGTEPRYLALVKRDIDAALAAGAKREPTIYVNGRYFSGLYPYPRLRELLVEELASEGNSTQEGGWPGGRRSSADGA